MNIYLKEITEDNWLECIELKIKKEQEKHLPHSNVKSIAEWKFNSHWVPLGIYLDEVMIGFSMHGLDMDDGAMWIIRFMIDEKYQGKGYGKHALGDLLNKIKSEYSSAEVWLSFHPESDSAKRLYTSYGFKQEITGFEADDEIFYKLNLLTPVEMIY